MYDIKQVMNEVPMPPSELRQLLLQEKKQKDYQDKLGKEKQDRLEREKFEREKLEKERLMRLEKVKQEREKFERERLEKERQDKIRRDKERLEQENKHFPKRDKALIIENQKYNNKPQFGLSPYTPAGDILSRNKPDLNPSALTPNIERNRNFNFFQKNDVRKNEGRPALNAGPQKDLIEGIPKRDVSPIRNFLVKKPERHSIENNNGSGSTERATERGSIEGSELKINKGTENKSDKSERKDTDSQSPKNQMIHKKNSEDSNFKKAFLKEGRESLNKEDSVPTSSRVSEPKFIEDRSKEKLAEIRSHHDEERKEMKKFMLSKKVIIL